MGPFTFSQEVENCGYKIYQFLSKETGKVGYCF